LGCNQIELANLMIGLYSEGSV